MKPTKKILIILIISLFAKFASADEGMWLVNKIDSQLFAQMKKRGLLLSPEQIYNPNGNAIKDAIVAINGGSCSGSIISANGLMITNHHCAYGDIHALSTAEKNYMEEGFWAFTLDREIPIKDKSVTFLRKVLDVTKDAMQIIDSLDKAGPRGLRFMDRIENALARQYGIDTKNEEVSLASMWRGTKYYLYFLETYEDVRLVGAPPVYIGAYGGEQDNWGWPQHKGDFAIYRVYMSKGGKPAKYSPDNIPYATDNFLKVSSKGVKSGDFTMILGYPGRTNRYVPSAEVQHKFEVLNPVISTVRRLKLETLKSKMDADPLIRLKYQDQYFGISNYCDYAKWENICIRRYHVVGIREKEETELKEKTLLEDIQNYYSSTKEISQNREIVRECMVRGSDWHLYATRLNSMIAGLKRKGINSIDITIPEVANFVKLNFRAIFLEGDPAVEKEVFITMFNYLINNVEEKYFTQEFKECLQKYDRDIRRYADDLYKNSFLSDPVRFMTFFTQTRTIEEALSDPMIALTTFSNIQWFNQQENAINEKTGLSISDLKSQYVKVLYSMRLSKGQALYPDANSTMRITYGTVGPLKPADGIFYDWYSTSTGILEKYNPNDYEFNMSRSYVQLLTSNEWGRWSNHSGQMPINFLSNNDITGGNSGSAVLNAKGELVGLAFDGNRDSMSGDLYFDAEKCKSVSVDIRYVLWVIEKYAKADYLLKEMTIH